MSLNPHQIDAELVRLSNLLETRAEDYATAVNRAAVADAAYRRLYAESMLSVIDGATSRMSVNEREARVDLLTADAYAAKVMSEATSKSVREAINALRVQIDVARTIAATVRSLTSPS